ncbi:hypothetical protein SKAU_G00321340 [Synaphobranchus kaupii]|uniref:Reverse transcriptase RNase H-like domain-containing protein n=1 Tax=Synaphobranchus kaupii TaxID=118154 RepID=A0A9Q1ENQ4_SYNKA|nr:hypothetical protein SKAU_G00321340 [Synaphobranchus kaupii]
MLNEDATPVACHTPIPVAIHWQDEVKAGLDQDVHLGVLEEVPIGTPVTWCHRMVICAKKSGKPRRTVDFQALNKHALRETHHTQSPFHQARRVPNGKRKTVFDAWNGYHSGYMASGDGYSRRYEEVVADIGNKTKCVDDTLLWSDTIEESYFQAVQWLDICGRNGIILNPEKFVFSAPTVDFAGFTITMTDVRPCSRYLEAIHDFPQPRNVTDIRSWFGLVNQVAYTFSMAERMQPFRKLLKSGERFEWSPELEDIFRKLKDVIVQEIERGVRIFDKTKPTCIATDWSKEGIGFWLFQKHCRCTPVRPFCCTDGWKITLVGSRFTHAAESRYAPIEGEALAVADALDKARYFVLGCEDLIVAVDHKPLLKLLADRALDDIPNPRLRNLKEKTLRYRFRIIHIPSMRNKAADAMSPRTPASYLSYAKPGRRMAATLRRTTWHGALRASNRCHVTVPALVVTPRLPDLVCDPVTPVARTGPTPPPVLTSVSPPRRGTPPASVTSAAPGLDTPRHVILRASPPAPVDPGAAPPLEPDMSPPAPEAGLRRSTRAAGVPAWHRDYFVG